MDRHAKQSAVRAPAGHDQPGRAEGAQPFRCKVLVIVTYAGEDRPVKQRVRDKRGRGEAVRSAAKSEDSCDPA